jgi:hypothetical protein
MTALTLAIMGTEAAAAAGVVIGRHDSLSVSWWMPSSGEWAVRVPVEAYVFAKPDGSMFGAVLS